MSGLAGQRLSRRSWLRGASGLAAGSVGAYQVARGAVPAGSKLPDRSCVFIFLFGGPSHIDLWDMKPRAPVEIRGEFRPIETNVPGIQVCEHLPLLAGQMDKLCLLRSMTHRMPVHGPACSEVYSGREYFGPPVTDQARPEDWPSMASLVHRFASPHGSAPTSVVLPWFTQFVGQDKRIAGQTGGRMGEQFTPFLVGGDLTSSDFQMRDVRPLVDVDIARLNRRIDLRHGLEGLAHGDEWQARRSRIADSNFRAAAGFVADVESTRAFDLREESDAVRDRYGRTQFGQSLLLARRLVESRVSLVTVNWDDESKSDKVSPHWDTHVNNFPVLKDRLCPPFDRAMSAFLEDLHTRGLLESTLVVALGEFGRTPRIGVVTQNGMTEKTGRDHWPHAFTALVAGGGVAGGQVYGRTNDTGGYVIENPVTPADLSATILTHLGLDPLVEYFDDFTQTTQHLSVGKPVEWGQR